MTTRPTRAMWWAETAVFLAVAAATFAGIIAFLASSAPPGRHATVDGGASITLIALSTGVGVLASARFRAWGLRRQPASPTRS
ncbi:hypothetical protein [Streptomyces sp. NPDC004376]